MVVSPSNFAVLATVVGAGLASWFAGPGLAFLVGILGTVAVAVLATREQNARVREARRLLLREAAWRATEGDDG